MRYLTRSLAAAAMVAMLAGCASTAHLAGPSPKEQAWLNHAGEPVESFLLFGHVSGWTPVSADKLVVYTGSREAWLVSVDATCLNLEFANGIGLTTSMGSRVHSGFDFVRFHDGMHGQDCRITDIRPVDQKAAREELKAASLKS